MKSVAERFESVEFRPSGFDYMRLVLASLVIVWHSFKVSGAGYGVIFDYLGVFGEFMFPMILGMFFALSGFLVAGSLERCKTLISFMGLRAIRIYPALAVEVLLSAFIIGPLLTKYYLGIYFSSPVFFSYLLNSIGDIHYNLPGLFLENPVKGIVNSQLWTVPWELACYVILAGLVLLGARKWPAIFPVAMAAGALFMMLFPHAHRDPNLLVAFLGGISIYYYRFKLPWHWAVFTGIVAIAFTSTMFHQKALVVLCIPYITVFLGLCNPPRASIIRGADYSYGMYLYGYVIQQALFQIFPLARHWYTNAVFALIVAAAFAAFSWYCVEKPALGLRTSVKRIESAILKLFKRDLSERVSTS